MPVTGRIGPAAGTASINGPQGNTGEQGPPGEVSQAALEAAITTAVAGTAGNPVGLGAFPGSFSDPPTQAEMQGFAAWVESLRTLLERAP